jgi:hypothetical protein
MNDSERELLERHLRRCEDLALKFHGIAIGKGEAAAEAWLRDELDLPDGPLPSGLIATNGPC